MSGVGMKVRDNRQLNCKLLTPVRKNASYMQGRC